MHCTKTFGNRLRPGRSVPARPACALLTCALFALYGCGDVRDELEKPLSVTAPLALDETLVFVDTGGNRAFLLDVGAAELSADAEVVALPHGPRQAVRRNGANEALILGVGRRASKDDSAEPASLSVLGADGSLRVYELEDNPFDSLSQSPDGRFAVLFKTGQAERLLDNRSEIAVVDLEADPHDDDAVSPRQLTFANAPREVVFSPQMRIAGEDRRLAIVLSTSQITLIDLDNPGRLETTAGLSTDNRAIEPTQLAFDEQAPVIYVRAANSDDVFVLQLNERSEGDAATTDDGRDRNDFRPVLNQVGAGRGPTDITPYTMNGQSRLLVTAGNQAIVVEGEANSITSVDLERTASRALLFVGESPRDAEVEQRALLYREGDPLLTFLDLSRVGERGPRATETISLTQPLTGLIPMLDEGLALVLHGSNAVTLLDLEARTLSPISAGVQLSDALFDRSRKRLWVGPPGQPFVGLLDVDTGDTDEILLDANVQSLVPVFGADRLVAVHASTVGHITVIDADDPERERAHSLRGFLLQDLLSRGEP